MTEEDKDNTEFFLAKMSSAVSKRCRSKMLEICLRKPKNLLEQWRGDHIDVLIHRESFTVPASDISRSKSIDNPFCRLEHLEQLEIALDLMSEDSEKN